VKYTNEWLREQYGVCGADGLHFVFFWKPSDDPILGPACLSQWHACSFVEDGVRYTTAEQYMMAQKAVLFGDEEVRQKIMEAAHPNAYKSLGRKVRNFDQAKWDANKTEIVFRGTLAKFSQNPALRDYLLGTGDAVLAEASPYDNIWGIHMRENDPNVRNPNAWEGENLLGFILMEARDVLRDGDFLKYDFLIEAGENGPDASIPVEDASWAPDIECRMLDGTKKSDVIVCRAEPYYLPDGCRVGDRVSGYLRLEIQGECEIVDGMLDTYLGSLKEENLVVRICRKDGRLYGMLDGFPHMMPIEINPTHSEAEKVVNTLKMLCDGDVVRIDATIGAHFDRKNELCNE